MSETTPKKTSVEVKRKPWYKQKRVIFSISVLVVLVSSFFASEELVLKIVSIAGAVITGLGYVFQEAWTDKKFKDILDILEIIPDEDEEK